MAKFPFFYGQFVCKRIMSHPYFEHFMLLSEAVYTLSKSYIAHTEFYSARIKLKEFVDKFEKTFMG